ncbi:NUDIX hydrolase [Arthrobacter sp. H14]|uniref:NUDIX hydrolase n=1 Tax=Arthrobacter sp. H14 TaxID=1312959 RepID=UPI00047BABD0|nr:NUDIX hydrolase [Arthrobacter sp. H14]
MATYPQLPGVDPVEPRLAVSVLMLRRDAPEVEVFIQHRVSTMDFAAGAVVFPGGRVDPVDYESAGSHTLPQAVWDRHALAWERSAVAVAGHSSMRDMSRVLVAAALREVQEETGAVLEAGELLPWANWVTPPGGPKRFDTYFYLAVVGPSLEPRHQTTEASASHWLPVREVLQGAADGTLQLMRPTYVLLTELADFNDLQKITASKRPIIPNGAAVRYESE